jgi:hypothetical protein
MVYKMQNCGRLACSADSWSCAASVAEISIDTVVGVAQAASFVASFGVSTAGALQVNTAKTTLKAGIKKAGSALLLTGSRKAFNFIKTNRKAILDRAKTKLIEKSEAIFKKTANGAVKKLQEEAVSQICGLVADNLVKSPIKEQGDQVSYAEAAIDGILGGAYKECLAVKSGKGTLNDQIACAKAAVDIISIIDPTGILSIAGTYMRPVCII